MNGEPLDALPTRNGHFLLESGYHTNRWLTLDGLFLRPHELAPLITALAARLVPHRVGGVCGPLLGGAFLAQALATAMGVEFYFSERVATPGSPGLFTAEYRLPPELHRKVRGLRLVVV